MENEERSQRHELKGDRKGLEYIKDWDPVGLVVKEVLQKDHRGRDGPMWEGP